MNVGQNEIMLVLAVVGTLTPIVGIINGAAVWALRTWMRSAIMENNAVLIKQMQETYVTKEAFEHLLERYRELKDRVAALEEIYRESST